MVQQPSGTVTLVFTDIEGSTRLLHEVGQEAYRIALAEHRRVVREAFGRYAGYEVDYEGDAFFYAFASANDALRAIVEAQAGLGSGPIRIRVGLHTGEPGLDPPKYVGLDVHRAARIMSAAHGGQVLLSKATRELVEAEVTDLGEHRLKDLSVPERLYQLGEGEFPPLRTLYRMNLPLPTTRFLGRERELIEAVELLARNEVRLLTLTGPGGTGKTRLAIQAAGEASDAYPDGVWWVPLAALSDPELVLPAVAQALGVGDDPGRGLEETLTRILAGKRLLLLFDNAEHLLPEVAGVISSLLAVDGPVLLVTSRERLQLSGEHVYPVSTLTDADGVDLFQARARMLDSGFEPTAVIPELCSRLDNLPLAIELAAARTLVLSPVEILDRLSQSLELLKGGRDADPRQQTLRATIEWSYDLLSSEERELFANLSVFAGGCTLAAAEEVARADLDTLASLADKSLVRRSADRFWMLETIREYAAERLRETNDVDELRRTHADYFERLAADGERGLRTSQHAPWMAQLKEDQANFRSAIESSLEHAEPRQALRIATRLWPFWESNAPTEGRAWLERALATQAGTQAERAQALHAAGRLAFFQGERQRAVESLTEAIELARQAADQETLVLSLGECSWALEELGRHEQAVPYAEECLTLAAQVPDLWVRAEGLNAVGGSIIEAGDVASGAEELHAESLRLRRALGAQQYIADSLNNLGLVALLRGNYEDARSYLEESLELASRAGDGFRQTLAVGNLGLVALFEDRYEDTATLLGENLRLCVKRGDRRLAVEAILGLSAALAALNKPETAIQLHVAALTLIESMGEVYPAAILDRVERHVQPARAALAEDVVAALSEQGRTMSPEAVLAELDRLD